MAVIFVDAFPYDTTKLRDGRRYTGYVVSGVGSGVIASGGRFGGNYLQFYGGSTGHFVQLTKNLPVPLTTLMIQFGYNSTTTGQSGGTLGSPYCPVFYFLDGSSEQCNLREEAGVFKLYRTNTLLASAPGPITANTWHQVELKLLVSSTAGTFLLKVDGVTVINVVAGDGKSTQATSHAYTTGIMWYVQGPNTSNLYASYSDLIFMDTAQVAGHDWCNDLLGARRVLLAMPTADGNYHQFTKSGGASNFGNVDEIPPTDDTDYNYTQTIGNKDTFVVPDVAAGAVVDAVVCDIYAKNADAVASTVKGTTRSNGVDGDGPEQFVGSSYNWYQSVIYEDPNNPGNQFNAAAFNAAEFGYKKAS